MKRTHNIEWSDILGSDNEDSGINPLVDAAKIKENLDDTPRLKYIGITMNYPRTKGFLNMNSKKQKDLYKVLWAGILNTLEIAPDNEYRFEFTKLGQVHLHGWIKVNIDKFYIMGALSDIAKAYLRMMPKKYQQFKEGELNPEYRRYRSPSICLQYYDKCGDKKDPSNIDYWMEYIKKEQ